MQNRYSYKKLLEMAVILIAFLMPATGFFTYFFLDDYIWMNYANRSIQDPSQFLLSLTLPNYWGFYRPAAALFWVLIFFMGGLNPYLSQAVIVCLFGFSAVYIMRLANLFSKPPAGTIAAALFITFVPVAETVWFRAGISLWGEICFMLMAAFYLITGIRKPSRTAVIMAFISAALAFGMKETAILLPCSFLMLRGKKMKVAVLGMLILSFLFLFVPRYQSAKHPGYPARKLALIRILREGNPEEIARIKKQIPQNFELFIFDNCFRRLTVVLYFIAGAGFYIARVKKKKATEPDNQDHVLINNKQNHIVLALMCSGLIFSIANIIGIPFILNAMILLIVLILFLSAFRIESVRFFLVWIAIFLFPPMVMGVATRHQIIESAAGIVVLSSIGFMHTWYWWKTGRLCSQSAKPVYGMAKNMCMPLSVALIIFTVLVHMLLVPTNWFNKTLQMSHLNRKVCSFLASWAPPGAEIAGTHLAGMISAYDIVFELKQRDSSRFKDATLSDIKDMSADVIIIGGENNNPYISTQFIQQKYNLVTRIENGFCFADVYKKKTERPKQLLNRDPGRTEPDE